MSKQFPGGIISKTPVTPSGPYETSTASGIWTLEQQAYWQKLGQWPTAGNPGPDAQFNYVTTLLQGDGTNAAQNNTFLDSSTNNFTITRNGNTTQGSFSPYGSNWSNYFNGSSSITAPDSSAFDYGSGDFTLECWIYPTTTNSGTILTAQTNGGNYGPCNLYFNSGALQLYSSSNGSSFDVASGASVGTPTVNQWSHVAVSRSGTSIRCFLNGTVTSTTTSSATLMNATGTFEIASRTGGEFYSGYVSNFRVVKGTAVYTSAFTPSTTPLTAISGTSLLTCADNRFIDDSTNNFTLTAIGTPSVQRFNPFGASTAYSTSVIGGAGSFDGSGDTLQATAGAVPAIGTSDFTLSGWWYLNELKNYQIFFDFRNGTNVEAVPYLYMGSTGLADYYLNGASNNLSINFRANEWSYVVVSRVSGTTKIFINGAQALSISDSTNYVAGRLNLGFNNSGGTAYYYNGYIADFKLVIGTGTTSGTPTTAPATATSGTQALLSTTNAGIVDNAMMNNLETVGNAQISTSVVKFGTGSMAFDGTGDYLRSPDNLGIAFGSGDFTVEGWIYLNNVNAGETKGIIYGKGNNSFGFRVGQSYLADVNGLSIARSNVLDMEYCAFTFAINTWYHIAVVRSGTTIYFFVNGTQQTTQGSGGSSYNFATPTAGYYFGANNDGNENFNGYIDSFRITKGYARYTSNFTPPTAAFSNFGPT